MFSSAIFSIQNKQRVAVVVVGYNRHNALQRLLCSLEAASYPISDVPLVISIDCSNDEKVYSLVREFHWTHGEKYVNIEKDKRLGLVNHIYQCGDLTKAFRAIILLEDDLFVSPYFYSYVLQSLEQYGDESRIAQIALYTNETNGFVGLPSVIVQDGNDVFLRRSCCTSGECWNERMWSEFCQWRDNICTDEIINAQDMPNPIKLWTRAWSRYFDAFLHYYDKYVVYPTISLTTNFSDIGGEHGEDNDIVQVCLQQGSFVYRMPSLFDISRYDSFGNNEALYDWLGMDSDKVCLDMFGMYITYNRKFVLSTRDLPYKIINSYGLKMRPMELNVKYDIRGEGIYLYDTSENRHSNNNYSKQLLFYFFQRINSRLLMKYIKLYIIKNIISKISRH